MITSQLLSLLWCPTCQADELLNSAVGEDAAQPGGGQLRCGTCESTYQINFGFPTLMPESALTTAEWREWRAHLDKFQARRMARIEKPTETINVLAEKSQPQPSFAKFTGIKRGTVLDVGCGPGRFRHLFDQEQVKYVGLDPITLPDVSDFSFVQGLAEYIPFKANTFTDIVVLAALDHFRDLDLFLAEARRVLEPGGRLHIMQSVHEVRGPISAVKVLAHKVKDDLEDRSSSYSRDVPKHLWEFTSKSLIDRLSGEFDVIAEERYSATWYSPVKLFLSFVPAEVTTHGSPGIPSGLESEVDVARSPQPTT